MIGSPRRILALLVWWPPFLLVWPGYHLATNSRPTVTRGHDLHWSTKNLIAPTCLMGSPSWLARDTVRLGLSIPRFVPNFAETPDHSLTWVTNNSFGPYPNHNEQCSIWITIRFLALWLRIFFFLGENFKTQ